MLKKLITVAFAIFALNAFAATDANRASQAELEAVKGVGPSLSGRMIVARSKQAFRNWDDMLERVKGVGPANAARFSSAGLTVNGEAYVASTETKTRAAGGRPAREAASTEAAKPARAARAGKPAAAASGPSAP